MDTLGSCMENRTKQIMKIRFQNGYIEIKSVEFLYWYSTVIGQSRLNLKNLWHSLEV